MAEVVVVGAGIGGLSAALELCARGHRVRVLEALSRPGGKAGIATVDGVEFDTGPSLLTLPEVFEELFSRTGARFRDEVELIAHAPAFRYLWPDGVSLEVFHDPAATLRSVRAALGADAERDLAGFLSYSREIWSASAPRFVYGPAPSLVRMLGLGLAAIALAAHIDPLRTMWQGICARVRSPHLRTLLARYATYNGSDVRSAPAALNCIAHVELDLGGYGLRGGIYSLVRAMVRRLEALGGRVELSTPVQKLWVERGRIAGVITREGRIAARAVVVNADAACVRAWLPRPGALPSPEEPSTSGWTAVLRARRRPRAPHTVLFANEYLEEFADLFDRDRPPATPTVYLCAQEPCHGRTGWPDAEPVFVMANAPCEPSTGPRPPEVFSALRRRVLSRAIEAGLLDADDAVVWERTPTGLATEFPGSRGAIYGAASNSRTAAFRRPPNRVKSVPGLYLASGSAHPGGGLPLCALSGRLAAESLHEDLHER